MAQTPLRESQKTVLEYTGGKMAVLAVPGAGKTFTLSHLAAHLVERLADARLAEEQEVLIVTFTNTAVNSFRKRIGDLLQEERGLLPYVGYRVRTLHGLAHDIVRMRPGLVGLSEGFEIVDESVSRGIMRQLAENWVRTKGDNLLSYIYLPQAESDDQPRWIIRQKGPELVEAVTAAAIRMGKDNRRDPPDLREKLEAAPRDLPLARIGVELYEEYQRSLSYRGAVDFDDLVRLAMLALETDPDFLARLQGQWPYILEDEAQDSSQLQNEMLRLLSTDRNWVRVGDPNQSIFTTFTTADANLLREFIQDSDVIVRPLPESGRSAPEIIEAANYLVRWSRADAILPPDLHGALADQSIEPTRPGDHQPNPSEGYIYLDWNSKENITPEDEVKRVTKSLEKYLANYADTPQTERPTIAVLVAENSRGFKVAEALAERGIPYEELLRSTSATRDAAQRLQIIFDFVADPTNSRALSAAFQEVWWPRAVGEADDPDSLALQDQITRYLHNLKATEDFLWPGLDAESPDDIPADLLARFRAQAQMWLLASDLPVDQLILTIAQELFDEAEDLALAYKIAVVLRAIAENNPEYRLPELSAELRQIASNQRRFLGFDDAATGYEPRPGVVTVSTLHAAKGLEWDRVYLMAVNTYSFPSAQKEDQYIGEKRYIRDELNLEAEAQEQLRLLIEGQPASYVEGEATRRARIEYAAERLRLLYVGITRAKRDLIITWNMGRFWDQGTINQPAAALIALSNFRRKGRSHE